MASERNWRSVSGANDNRRRFFARVPCHRVLTVDTATAAAGLRGRLRLPSEIIALELVGRESFDASFNGWQPLSCKIKEASSSPAEKASATPKPAHQSPHAPIASPGCQTGLGLRLGVDRDICGNSMCFDVAPFVQETVLLPHRPALL
eukprot:CAMPEP_0172752584 /NCGR_PEP_ID=MMETSP1074-20121228/154088_1 /TAXON_ID=2916 /ORGANISM="Ceratium fusus, Strain PA161109" /LENGTH=147 /DNA_ID=CAMNT_0013585101 /DNA_START=356 /DNA_END=800 /DNA_ORIENTATION=+